MKQKLQKLGFMLATMMLVIVPMFTLALSAQANDDPFGTGYVTENINLSDADPRTVAMKIVSVLMTFLGIIAVVVILLGGFKWMTAGGNEDKVSEARKLIISGIIGLVIILSAWAIVNFVLTNIQGALESA